MARQEARLEREENENGREVIKREESKKVEREECETVVEEKRKERERKGEMSWKGKGQVDEEKVQKIERDGTVGKDE